MNKKIKKKVVLDQINQKVDFQAIENFLNKKIKKMITMIYLSSQKIPQMTE